MAAEANLGYQLMDAGGFQKLEQVGPYKLIRPSPQAVWAPGRPELWHQVDATYHRYSGGDGRWEVHHSKFPDSWPIEMAGVKACMRLTDFGHLGIFAEQYQNWLTLQQHINSLALSQPKVLNLFAYTGMASLACARAGAEVVHVDASKTSVAWARENAALSKLEEAPIRWIVDDVQKFVSREVRRGNRYHGIILDPPSFGRGAKNEVWKIEEHLIPLMELLNELREPQKSFVMLSCHSQGYTPVALRNLLITSMSADPTRCEIGEMLIADQESRLQLPSGAFAWAEWR